MTDSKLHCKKCTWTWSVFVRNYFKAYLVGIYKRKIFCNSHKITLEILVTDPDKATSVIFRNHELLESTGFQYSYHKSDKL